MPTTCAFRPQQVDDFLSAFSGVFSHCNCCEKCYYCNMTRELNREVVVKWRNKVGTNRAIMLVIEHLDCSVSKAQKLVYGNYPSVPGTPEQKILAELMKVHRDRLFPVVESSFVG